MKVISYNILADAYIKPEWYPDVPPERLKWLFRKKRLLEQLLELKADILCLQEVEGCAFDYLFEGMKVEGYQGIYGRKGFGRVDGCATFFKKNLLDFEGANTIMYNDHGGNRLASGHVAVILKLMKDNAMFGIVNTHIRWDLPEKPPEEHRGYQEVNELSNKYLSDDCVDHWIICGDFNTEAETPVIQLLLQKGFRDVYEKEKSPTMNKEGLVRIDYIFHSPELKGIPEPIYPLTDKCILPSEENPSDHLPIGAKFSAT